MLSYAVSTWPHLKAYLRSEVEDPLLAEALIDAATKALEGEARNALVSRSFVEQYTGGMNGARGGAKRLYLKHYPINSVTSIIDTGDATHTVPATDFGIIAAEGILEHVGHFPAPLSPGLWQVTYNSGRFATIDAVDEDVRLACHMQVAYWLNRPREAVMNVSSDGKSRAYRFVGEADLLPEAKVLMRDYRRVEV